MKLCKRVLAVFLAVLTAFSLCMPAFAAEVKAQEAPKLTGIEDYKAFLESARATNYGDHFYGLLRVLRFIIRLLFGQTLLPDTKFDVSIDPIIEGYCAYIAENTHLDVTRILKNLPDVSLPAQLLATTFSIDTAALRDAFYDKRDELWDEGNHALSNIYFFLGAYFSVMQKCDIVAEPTEEDPDVCEVVLYLKYRDGGTEELRPGIFLDSKTGAAYNDNDKGLVDTGFNCSMYDLLVYAPINAWMRDFGFCFFYDFFCYITPNWIWNYTTRRCKFDYDGKQWMIQFWKGSYLFTNGGEIGVYNREKKMFGSYYECVQDDDMLVMSMTMLHENEELFTLPAERHWWINGFRMAKKIYLPNALTMRATIVMRDQEMLNAFCKSLSKNYRHDVRYWTKGLAVTIEW